MTSYFDGSDLQGVSHPKEIKYVGYVRFWLRIVGSWPSRPFGEPATTAARLFTFFNLFLATLCWVLMVAFVSKHIKVRSFFQMGQVYINTFMCTIYATRTTIPLTAKYEHLMGEFFNVVHLFHHKHRSDYAMKMHLFVHKVSYMFTVFMIGATIWGYILYNVIPLYNNWSAGGYGANMPANFSYEYAIDYEVPFDFERNPIVHWILLFFILYTGVGCSICFCLNDLLVSLQVIHLWGHVKILIHSLENFPRPARSTNAPEPLCYTKEENADVARILKDIVVHHNLILRNMENISSTFGLAIGVYYLYHQLCNCVLLLEISNLDTKALLRYGPLTLIILQLQIQISAVFELLKASNDKLVRAVYSLPWELMDVRNRRAVLIILTQSQRPLGLKAVGMVEVGMQTTVTILKTTLSYFIMLKTIAMK